MSSRVHKRDSTTPVANLGLADRRHATPTTGVALLARGAGTGGGGGGPAAAAPPPPSAAWLAKVRTTEAIVPDER